MSDPKNNPLLGTMPAVGWPRPPTLQGEMHRQKEWELKVMEVAIGLLTHTKKGMFPLTAIPQPWRDAFVAHLVERGEPVPVMVRSNYGPWDNWISLMMQSAPDDTRMADFLQTGRNQSG